MKAEAYLKEIKRGYHQVFLFVSTNTELLVEEIFEYSQKRTAERKLNELKKKYKLIPNYYNGIITFENENIIEGV